tara:strand:+ start:195574 stop:196233 length:660 start_codon:yes stop_codon:yes gene_type:complete
MTEKTKAVLYYIHDPMCSWCWGFRRSWDQMREALSGTVTVINVVGGLAPDSEVPMPLEQQRTIAGYWEIISRKTGAEFNFDFWTRCQPRRSTYPACRAVLAAAKQQAELEMIDAIQRAYYLHARNPSDNSTLVSLAGELGLNVSQFTEHLASTDIQTTLEENFALSRKLGVAGFPSLVLACGASSFPIPVNYQSHQTGLDRITSLLESFEQSSNMFSAG